MIQFSACLDMLYKNLPFAERLQRVADAGLPAFEFWGWYDKDVDAIRRVMDETGLKLAIFGTWLGGALVDTACQEKLPHSLEKSIEVAKRLDCQRLVVQTGNEIKGVPRKQQYRCIVDALRQASDIAAANGITLCLEPLNILVDHAGYYLSTSAEALQIVDEVASPGLKLLYDVYHQQITEGNLCATITENIDSIQHIHVADVPGRHEPGTGEINYRVVFEHIAATGYDGYVGLEYVSKQPEDETLAMLLAMTADL